MKKNIQPKPAFLERMKKLLNQADFEKYEEIIQEPLLNSIRCNTLKISPEQLKKRFEEKGWKISQPWSSKFTRDYREAIGKRQNFYINNDFSMAEQKPNLKNSSELREGNHPEVMIIEGKFVDVNDLDINEKNNINKNELGIDINKKAVDNNKQISANKVSSKFSQQGRVGGTSLKNQNKKILVDLEPGELGRSIEHLLGYYYVQELASMLSAIALKPKSHELILDLCASPGSKTSQIASQMQNTGTIIANDISIERIKILASNLERCGITNTIITRDDGIRLCEKFKSQNIKFDKILLDAPCSGEGTMRSSPKTGLMWNPHTIKSLSKLQKKLFQKVFEILKTGGEIVYSTCTHAPEENEAVVDFALKEFGDKIEIEKINLPVKCREGITSWEDEKYDSRVKESCRIYPQDNNTEGFFLAKFKKLK